LFLLSKSHHINIALASESEVLVHDLAYLDFSDACFYALSVAFLPLTMNFETPNYAKIIAAVVTEG
jgi:hypothetical protein